MPEQRVFANIYVLKLPEISASRTFRHVVISTYTVFTRQQLTFLVVCFSLYNSLYTEMKAVHYHLPANSLS